MPTPSANAWQVSESKPEAQMERLLNREPSPVDKVFVETKDFGLILSGHRLGQDEKKPDKHSMTFSLFTTMISTKRWSKTLNKLKS